MQIRRFLVSLIIRPGNKYCKKNMGKIMLHKINRTHHKNPKYIKIIEGVSFAGRQHEVPYSLLGARGFHVICDKYIF